MSPPLIEPLARTAKTIGTVFRDSLVASAHVPTYGSSWGFVIAADDELLRRPDPDRIDERLRQVVTGKLRMFDGQTLLGLLQTPKYVRDRIASETVIYTVDNPPQIAR